MKINTDGLKQIVYMFSPEWRRMRGMSKISDDELLLELDDMDKKSREETREHL